MESYVALHKSQLVFSPTLTQMQILSMGCFAVRATDPELSLQIRLGEEHKKIEK